MMKAIKWIAGAIIAIGFIGLLFTAGASDSGAIGISEVIVRIICCFGAIGCGMATIYIVEEKENA